MKLSSTLVFLFMICITTKAQVFVNPAATGTNDGSSWSNAFTNLQDALDQSDPNDQIWLAAGKYVPEGPTPDSTHFLATHAVHIYGGFAGTETNISQRDWTANLSIISGDVLGDDIMGNFTSNRLDNAHHVLIINAPNTQSVLDGLVFESGTSRLDTYAAGPLDIPYNRWSGGALYFYRSGAVVRNSVFHNNDAIRGSGCYAFGDTLHTISLEFDHVVFRDNNGYNGAGAFFSGLQNLTIRNSQLKNNSGFQGGALFFSGTNAIVEDCEFELNSSTFGGAINGFHSNVNIPYPVIKINRSKFINNTGFSRGGGVYYYNTYGGCSIEVDSCIFNDNETAGSGGGLIVWDAQDVLANDAKSRVSITNSNFNTNLAGFGGGVEIEGWDDSMHIEIVNSNFIENIAEQGGGVSLSFSDGAVVDCEFKGNEFRNNVVSAGGGLLVEIYNNSSPLHYLMDDCLIIDNTAEAGGGLLVQSFTLPGGIIGSISNSSFFNNHGSGTAGAIYSYQGDLSIEDSYFKSNSTAGTLDSFYQSGGAITVRGLGNLNLNRNIFEGNTSLTEGSALSVNIDGTSSIINTLFHHQEGNSTIYNAGNMGLRNITMVENEGGLFLQTASSTEIQNSIFDNQGDNLEWIGKAAFISKGGNISSDATMENLLTGHGSYTDLNDTNPLLGPDFVPVSGSPAIDLGNVEGIKNEFDLAGNARVQGGAIDAGSFESFLSATHDAVWNAPQLSIYPNPVKDVLNVKINVEWTGEVKLMVYNQAGQKVHQANIIKKNANEILQSDIHNMVPGEYFLLVRANNETYATNLVIAR